MAEQNNISHESALHFLDQVAKLMTVLEAAKVAIQMAVQLEQGSVNLQKRNAKLREENGQIEEDIKALRLNNANEIREHKAQVARITAAARKEEEAEASKINRRLNDLQQKFDQSAETLDIQIQEKRAELEAITGQIPEAKANLAQITADYEAIKLKFK